MTAEKLIALLCWLCEYVSVYVRDKTAGCALFIIFGKVHK